jgi:hypothetical protein
MHISRLAPQKASLGKPHAVPCEHGCQQLSQGEPQAATTGNPCILQLTLKLLCFMASHTLQVQSMNGQIFCESVKGRGAESSSAKSSTGVTYVIYLYTPYHSR